MSSVLRLPYELCVQIAADPCLSRHDLASLRLASRLFATPAASILFRRVVVSRLRKDRAHLEHIAASGHLARHVRALAWHELDLEAWRAPGEPAADQIPARMQGVHVEVDDYFAVKHLMLDAACDPDLFWFPRRTARDTRGDVVEPALAWFLAVVARLPHLTAFISCPMPRSRTFACKEYPIQSDSYRYQCRGESETSNKIKITKSQFLEVLEAMKHADSGVRSLVWQDENDHFTAPGNNGRCWLGEQHVPAFRPLTRLHLCMSGLTPQQADSTGLCLEAAMNLEHLTLCFERRDWLDPNFLVETIMARCAWPCLVSLEVSHTTFENRRRMAAFLRKCPRVRRLVLRECMVSLANMLELQQISACQLDSIVITGGSHYVSESSLVDFVNRRSAVLYEPDGDVIVDFSEEYMICTQLRTDDAIICTCPGDDSDGDGDDDSISSIPDDGGSEELPTLPTTGRHRQDTPWDQSDPDGGNTYYYSATDYSEDVTRETTTTTGNLRDGDGFYVGGDPLEYFSDWNSEDGEDGDGGGDGTP
ncbi:hypothetical protein F4802DRAFT_598555 [Xylaria palmicola]|nr:hypothetical protein F4802DRAFT_598555 [Xylaria palmicola]